MSTRWLWLAQLGLLAALVVTGCHTTQPDLKPPKQPEVFSGPPTNFSNNYPKQAFNSDDPAKRLGLDSGGIMPVDAVQSAPRQANRPARIGCSAVELLTNPLRPHKPQPIAKIQPQHVELRFGRRLPLPARPPRPRSHQDQKVKELDFAALRQHLRREHGEHLADQRACQQNHRWPGSRR